MQSRFGIDQSFAVLIGLNEEADFLKVFIDDLQPHGIRIAGRMEFDSAFAEAMSDKPEEPFEKFIGKLEGSIREHNAIMIISADKRLSLAQIMQILELADRLDVAIKILSDKMDVIMNQARMPVDMVHGVPLVHFEIPSAGGMGMPERVRRGLSIAFGYLATAVLFPGMGLMALLIRLTSQGPVFFIQERIGVNRKPFRMYKFRTMYDRADEAQAEMEEFNESGRGLFKIRKDPRVTPVGRFLRRFSLDELPQLINVIRGEMVIVGPRPLPRRDFENYYEEWHYSRHSGMPGLTCLWQVSGRSEIDFHNMCILDVFYLRNRNWILDLKIILRTFWVVLFAKGAY